MLIKQIFDSRGDTIKMVSVYDHSDIFRRNYEQRMGRERYLDKGHDFMRVARIPLAMWAHMSAEEKYELQTNPKAFMKFLQANSHLRTSMARV
ncbi:MAG: hypothetical protein H6Q74_2192 [Firmicutes bacterium]|nr:hypothetical protein [Bacillota bacterium]